jgi:hypothetical protein
MARSLIGRVIALAGACFVVLGSLYAFIEFQSGKDAFNTTLRDISVASVPPLSVSFGTLNSTRCTSSWA